MEIKHIWTRDRLRDNPSSDIQPRWTRANFQMNFRQLQSYNIGMLCIAKNKIILSLYSHHSFQLQSLFSGDVATKFGSQWYQSIEYNRLVGLKYWSYATINIKHKHKH